MKNQATLHEDNMRFTFRSRVHLSQTFASIFYQECSLPNADTEALRRSLLSHDPQYSTLCGVSSKRVPSVNGRNNDN